jgi:hypothetical protein
MHRDLECFSRDAISFYASHRYVAIRLGGHLALGTALLAQGKLEAALSEMQQEQPDSGRYAGLPVPRDGTPS